MALFLEVAFQDKKKKKRTNFSIKQSPCSWIEMYYSHTTDYFVYF